MDEKQRNISQLERVVSSLEYHLEKYKESKCCLLYTSDAADE